MFSRAWLKSKRAIKFLPRFVFQLVIFVLNCISSCVLPSESSPPPPPSFWRKKKCPRAMARPGSNPGLYQEICFNQEVKQNSIYLYLSNYLWGIFYKSNRGLFARVSIVSSKHSENLKEFSTIIQTLDCVLGLHNCLEFSQLPLVFRWGYGNKENVLYCLIVFVASSMW